MRNDTSGNSSYFGDGRRAGDDLLLRREYAGSDLYAVIGCGEQFYAICGRAVVGGCD